MIDAIDDDSLCAIEAEYDAVFYRAGIARRAVQVIDEAIASLKLQRRALEADVRVKERAFTDFLVAHPEVREITELRRLRYQAARDREQQP